MSRTRERLDVFKLIFSSLYQDFKDKDEFINFIKNEQEVISENQWTLLLDVFQNQNELIKRIGTVLKDNWSWERLCKVEQSVLLIALGEAETWKTDKAVIINESLTTIKKYGIMENYKYINALLEKLLV